MIIKNIRIENFRNIELARISPHKKINIFYGENAQGKTNIIEALWLLTGEKSFRKAKDSEMLKFDKDYFKIKIKFESREREQEAEIKYRDKEKKIILNNNEVKKRETLSENFAAVVFSPDDLSIVSDGPSARREFLDNAIIKIYPAYEKILKDYNKAIFQRNNALKFYRTNKEMASVLDAYEEKIAKLGIRIIKYRNRFVELLNEYCPTIFSEITEKKESIKISYWYTVVPTLHIYTGYLWRAREEDQYSLTTSIGPHRDNLELNIDGVSSRNYGSQGQKRTVALCLKLAEGEIIHKITGIRPIILLDDVMSELDKSRQNYILNRIKNWQVFITCCDPSNISGLKKGRIFKVKKGRCIRE